MKQAKHRLTIAKTYIAFSLVVAVGLLMWFDTSSEHKQPKTSALKPSSIPINLSVVGSPALTNKQTSRRNSDTNRLGKSLSAEDATGHRIKTENQTSPDNISRFNKAEFGLAIAGKITTRKGIPTPDITLTATLTRSFTGEQQSLDRQGDALSDINGQYRFSQLSNGEYLIQTDANEHFATAQILVRAGIESADIILDDIYQLVLTGQVTDDQGVPLTNVYILPLVSGVAGVSSNQEGRFQLNIGIKQTSQKVSLTARKKGYQSKLINIPIQTSANHRPIIANITLTALTTTGHIKGTLTNLDGDLLADLFIQIYSSQLRSGFSTYTDSHGEFIFENIPTANDYRLQINSDGIYKEYQQHNINITADDIQLNIVLQDFEGGQLKGQMTDANGKPLPYFSLTLRSKNSPLFSRQVTSDNRGRYYANNVPSGSLSFVSHVAPIIDISGIELPVNAEISVPLRLDWGDQQIHGWIKDENGAVISNQPVSLYWQYSKNRIHSTSRRTTQTDTSGHFSFTQLGLGGLHSIAITRAGFRPYTKVLNNTDQKKSFNIQLIPH